MVRMGELAASAVPGEVGVSLDLIDRVTAAGARGGPDQVLVVGVAEAVA
jgi:hypothetical protein